MSRIGLANGSNWVLGSLPKYSFWHNINRDGKNIPSENECSLDGVYLILKSVAGYINNIAFGNIGYFYFIKYACKAHAIFPPAESPANIIFLGLILIC